MRTRAARTAVALSTGLGLSAVFGAGIALTARAVPAAATNSHPKTITISTANVSHVGTVLTTSSGRTLYRFTDDPAKKSTCAGACAKIWPPLRVTKGTHIKGPKGVKGLSLINVGGGHWQVAFHNVALYRFEGDTKKGEAKGQAVGGVWYAVLKSGVPAGAAGAAPAAAASTSTSTTTPATSTSTQPPMATSQPPATQPTSPARTSPPATAPPPMSPPTTSPPPTTTPTTTAGNGGVGF